MILLHDHSISYSFKITCKLYNFHSKPLFLKAKQCFKYSASSLNNLYKNVGVARNIIKCPWQTACLLYRCRRLSVCLLLYFTYIISNVINFLLQFFGKFGYECAWCKLRFHIYLVLQTFLWRFLVSIVRATYTQDLNLGTLKYTVRTF